MKAPLSRIPLLGPAAAFAAGIACASGPAWLLYVAMAMAAGVGVTAIVVRRHYTAIVAIALLMGEADYAATEPAAMPASLEGRRVACSGRVGSVDEREWGLAIRCTIDSAGGRRIADPFKAILWYLSPDQRVAPGQTISFVATLSPLEATQSVPDTFDYDKYLLDQGFAAKSTLTPDDLTAVAGEPSQTWRWRSSIIHHLSRLPLAGGTFEFLCALTLGERSMIDDTEREAFARAGIAHVLALSGLHVAIIASLLGLLLLPLKILRLTRTRAVMSIAALWMFAALTGMSPSVVRAVIMATFVLTGRVLQRESSPVNSLLGAALLLLMVEPRLLWGIGFQLSFTAVGAILVFTPALQLDRERPAPVRTLWAYITASTAAMMSAGILSMYYFHTLPLYFLLGNVVAALLLPPLLIVGAVLAVFSFTGLDMDALCLTADTLYGAMRWIVEKIGALPGASISDIYISRATLALLLLTVAALAMAVHGRRRVWLTAAAMTAITAVPVHILARESFPETEYFVESTSAATTILIKDGASTLLVTTEPERRHAELAERTGSRFRGYMQRRGMTPVAIAPDTIDTRYVSRRGPLIDICGKRILLLGDADALPDRTAETDMMIVTRRFKGDIVKVCSIVAPDTVVIGADVNRLRALRYERECREAGVRACLAPRRR